MNLNDEFNGNERIDDLHIPGFKIIQSPDVFCFGTDAVLLAHFAKATAYERVCDLCSGNGIIPILMCDGRQLVGHITGVEIQERLYDMAVRSVTLCGLQDVITMVNHDICDVKSIFKAASFDIVTVNPPYRKSNDGEVSPHDAKSIARHELKLTLEDVIKAGAFLLGPKGRFCMVHRPERLTDIIDMCRKYKLEPKTLRMVHPKLEMSANLMLIECKKDANSGIKVLPPLFIRDEKGNTPLEVDVIYGKNK